MGTRNRDLVLTNKINIMETELENYLKVLRRKTKYIKLSLYPGIGETTISRKEINRCFVKSDRGVIEFKNISEPFYDRMVELYHKN